MICMIVFLQLIAPSYMMQSVKIETDSSNNLLKHLTNKRMAILITRGFDLRA